MRHRLLVRWMTVAVFSLAPGVVVAADVPPTTQPLAEVKNPAKISAEAKSLIKTVSDAYLNLKSLDLTGTINMDLQVEGSKPETHKTEFSASFLAPNRFRHQARGDVLLGSTGKKLYAYQTEQNSYTEADAPPGRTSSNDLPQDLSNLLGMQNPSLMLAMSKDPAREILDDVTEAASPDANTLKLNLKDKTQVTMAFDPESHLLRQVKTDLTAPLKKRRADLVNAVLTIDYTASRSNNPAKDELFAWSPPPGAIDAATAAAAQPLDNVAAAALEGKQAPAFKLKTLEGKTISLAEMRGHVVILDFWATWCGPCRMALPQLEMLYKAEKDNGLLVFAVNQQESEADVLPFVKETALSIPVLMDPDGRVNALYGVEPIPQTVVIDKEGKVRNVFIGLGPDYDQQLKHAIKAAGM